MHSLKTELESIYYFICSEQNIEEGVPISSEQKCLFYPLVHTNLNVFIF